MAKKHDFEYRAPTGSLDRWEVKEVDVRSAAGDPMKSAAGDPNLEHLFHPQLKFEDGNFTMVREAGGDSIRIRCAFAVTLACVLVEFSKAASAAEIYEMYKAWPLVHAKKERQKAGAPSTSRWWRKSSSWWGGAAGPAGARLGRNPARIGASALTTRDVPGADQPRTGVASAAAHRVQCEWP